MPVFTLSPQSMVMPEVGLLFVVPCSPSKPILPTSFFSFFSFFTFFQKDSKKENSVEDFEVLGARTRARAGAGVRITVRAG